MSNLKHQTVEQLQESKVDCEWYIHKLKGNLSGQEDRDPAGFLGINKYLHEKTPQELSMREIEQRLGHRVILTEGK